jgi:hypothetical protein
MKKFILITRAILTSIKNWFLEELLFYIRFTKSKYVIVAIKRAKKAAKDFDIKTGRPHFIFDDRELGIFLKHNWPYKFEGKIYGKYVILCRGDLRFLQRQTVDGKKVIRKMNILDLDKLTIFKTR